MHAALRKSLVVFFLILLSVFSSYSVFFLRRGANFGIYNCNQNEQRNNNVLREVCMYGAGIFSKFVHHLQREEIMKRESCRTVDLLSVRKGPPEIVISATVETSGSATS